MYKNLKFYLSLILGRSAYLGIRLLSNTSGTSFAGKTVLKFYPEFLTHCRNFISKQSITVSGTNGKTTTSGLIAGILEETGSSVIHNIKGANMLTGVANVFALNLTPNKKFDYSVIESDEAYLNKLYDYFPSDYLVVTNLFRDQLDRYGELATTAGLIRKAIDKNPELTLLLNADDPLVTNLGADRKNIVYYGFENVSYNYEIEKSVAPTEVFNCVCGKPLNYSKQFFAQQGHYNCVCGYSRPNCKYKANAIISKDFSQINIETENQTLQFKTSLVGLYNAYNVLAAITLALELNIPETTIQQALNSYKSIFGRTEKRTINGHDTIIQLIKNPTGASEVLKTINPHSNVIIAINDNYADGRDISWLWDSDFEQISKVKKRVIASGIRANDVATRLKYAGVNADKIEICPDLKTAINLVTQNNENKQDSLTILPSYTALLSLNKMKLPK